MRIKEKGRQFERVLSNCRPVATAPVSANVSPPVARRMRIVFVTVRIPRTTIVPLVVVMLRLTVLWHHHNRRCVMRHRLIHHRWLLIHHGRRRAVVRLPAIVLRCGLPVIRTRHWLGIACHPTNHSVFPVVNPATSGETPRKERRHNCNNEHPEKNVHNFLLS